MSHVGFAVYLSLLLVPSARAAEAGITFTHNDWVLVCDNTRTCRAAGYQSEEGGEPISVLLTREAGPAMSVRADVVLGDYEREDSPEVLSMHIDGKNLGAVNAQWSEVTGSFTQSQLDALLRALRGVSTIVFHGDVPTDRWELSGVGATAVLLKMDEFQGRLDTPGALIQSGTRSEASVLPALPMPVLRVAPHAIKRPQDLSLVDSLVDSRKLREALISSLGDEECDDLSSGESGRQLDVERLTDTKMLISTRCWMGAYNVGLGYWVVNENAPFEPVLVTTGASHYGDGVIQAAHKSRGIGDCWWTASWIWDGHAFVYATEGQTGLCRLVQAGGAWDMPTLVTEVIQ